MIAQDAILWNFFVRYTNLHFVYQMFEVMKIHKIYLSFFIIYYLLRYFNHKKKIIR